MLAQRDCGEIVCSSIEPPCDSMMFLASDRPRLHSFSNSIRRPSSGARTPGGHMSMQTAPAGEDIQRDRALHIEAEARLNDASQSACQAVGTARIDQVIASRICDRMAAIGEIRAHGLHEARKIHILARLAR